ncbi:MAG TPA: LPS assembly lipoprotein LptE [Xanthobacteraceae bacterium]|nr:LPS assembly lipoprotein LptE [Xanthobacteraceae bacterium]
MGLRATLVRGALIALLAAPAAGCFQPLYGDRTVTGDSAMKTALASVGVQQIVAPNGTPEARIAVQLRNDLLFALGGGQTPSVPSHILNVRISSTRLSVIVDTQTARPDVENYGLTALYELVDQRTNKVVVKGTTFSRVSYDIPGQQQRFARQRALRDAEDRAAQVIADNIRNRLASYFVAGT